MPDLEFHGPVARSRLPSISSAHPSPHSTRTPTLPTSAAVPHRRRGPLPSAKTGVGPGAALPCGSDFFLAGNRPSLTVVGDQEPGTNSELRLPSGERRTANDVLPNLGQSRMIKEFSASPR